MRLVDSHAHLDDARLAPDLARVLARAGEAGVEAVVTVGIDLVTSLRAVELAATYPMVYAAVGIHPHEAAAASGDMEEELARLAGRPKVVAIGEVGLDYHYNYSPPEVQQEVLARQLALARRLGLPVIVHDREAHADVRRLLVAGPGIVHCFSGEAGLAVGLIERGFYLSFAGNITFPAAAELREVAAAVPVDRLLIETDCPYLAPVPYRGRCNEPAYVAEVAREVARVRGMVPEEVAAATAANAERLLGLPRK